MIITVTMNPAMDKTVEVESLRPGMLNRIKRVYEDIGGKGINVSKTIKALGGESLAIGFLSGNTGQRIEKALKDLTIKTDFIWTEGETRTNTKVVDANGCVTELNEMGPLIPSVNLEELKEKVAFYAKKDCLFLLSGSVPPGISKQVYAELLELIHKNGSRAVLDADGELFSYAVKKQPDYIKPNQYELFEYFNLPEAKTEGEERQSVGRCVQKLKEMGIPNSIVSLGKSGACFSMGDNEEYVPALSVKVRSTVGAGDAMVAGLALALERGLSGKALIRLCMAVSAGAVMTEGTNPPDQKTVEELMKNFVL